MRYLPMHSKIGDSSDLHRSEFLFEPKLDGIRAICYYGKKPTFYGRKGQRLDFDISFTLPMSCVLDGEIVAYNSKGIPDFYLLQSGGKATYVVFDVLEMGKKKCIRMPLEKRKKLLDLLKDQENFQTLSSVADGRKLMQFVKKKKLEGVMAKQKGSIYTPGQRSESWKKIKLSHTVDCVILGTNKGKRAFGSLQLGLYDKKGILHHIGNAGTGFSDRLMNDIIVLLATSPPNSLVCEVKYQEFNELLRAPVFLRFRNDMDPHECTLEQLKV